LDVTASRLLRSAKVKQVIQGHVQKAERAMGASEAIDRLSDIARLPDTELADMADFITLIRPEEAAKRRDPARAAGCGFYIDLAKALKRGKTHLIRELAHDAETGAPKIKLQDNLAVWELSRKALSDLATIYGLKKGSRPPEPPKVELWRLLELLPNDVLLVLKNATVQAKQHQTLADAREKA